MDIVEIETITLVAFRICHDGEGTKWGRFCSVPIGRIGCVLFIEVTLSFR